MTKKLNITSITNELEESAFFPKRKTPAVTPTPPSVVEEPRHTNIKETTIQAKPQMTERVNARTY